MSSRSRSLPRRSCLTVPGSSPKMIAKAAGVPADMVILDLEDAVAVDDKGRARADVADAVGTGDWGDRVVGVRVNDWSSPWTVADLTAVVGGSGGRLDVVVVPKVEDPGMVRATDLVLAQVEHAAGLPVGHVGVEAQIETAGGVQAVAAIATASPRMEALALGPLDLAASLGMPADGHRARSRFAPITSAMVVAARAAGIAVVDGPFVAVRDLDDLAADSAESVGSGFDGRWALHPDQVPILNQAFAPSPDEFARALRVLDALDDAAARGAGAVLLDGEMIDEASSRHARVTVERGRRAGIEEHQP